jgi:hypothetical protein
MSERKTERPSERPDDSGDFGDFDRNFRHEDLSKEALVRLAREFALIAQLLDRSVFAAIGLR